MKAVLTGDIINSQQASSPNWLKALRSCLALYGEETKSWEVYRGDSFQLSLKAEEALKAVMHIKSCVRQFTPLDARVVIGLGEEDFHPGRVLEANGSAYVRSGNAFEGLKKNKLLLASGNKAFDQPLNIMLQLAQLSINSWTSTVAAVVEQAILHPEWKQIDIAKHLNKSQSNISEALKRAGFDEILMVEEFYRKALQQL